MPKGHKTPPPTPTRRDAALIRAGDTLRTLDATGRVTLADQLNLNEATATYEQATRRETPTP